MQNEREIVAGNPVAGFVQIEVRAIDDQRMQSNGYITMEVIALNKNNDNEENGYCYA